MLIVADRGNTLGSLSIGAATTAIASIALGRYGLPVGKTSTVSRILKTDRAKLACAAS